MANDPTQDKDFLAASPADQHAYLMATDPGYAKASPDDQKAYLSHVTGGAQSPAPPPAPRSLLQRAEDWYTTPKETPLLSRNTLPGHERTNMITSPRDNAQSSLSTAGMIAAPLAAPAAMAAPVTAGLSLAGGAVGQAVGSKAGKFVGEKVGAPALGEDVGGTIGSVIGAGTPLAVKGVGTLITKGATPAIPPGLSPEATTVLQNPAARRGTFKIQRALAPSGSNADFIERTAVAAPRLGQMDEGTPIAGATDANGTPVKGGIIRPDQRLRFTVDNIENAQKNLWQTQRMPQIQRNAMAPTTTRAALTAGMSDAEVAGLEREFGGPIPNDVDLQTADRFRQAAASTLNKVNQMTPEGRYQTLQQNPILEKLDGIKKQLNSNISDVLTAKGEPGVQDFDRQYGAMQEVQDAARSRMNPTEVQRVGDNATIRANPSMGLSILERLHLKPSPGRLLEQGLTELNEGGVRPPASTEPPPPSPAIAGLPGSTPPAQVAPAPVGQQPPPMSPQNARESVLPNQPQAIGRTGDNAIQVNTLPTEHPGEGNYAGLLPGPPAPFIPPPPGPPMPQVGGIAPVGFPVETADPMWTGEARPGIVPTRGPAAFNTNPGLTTPGGLAPPPSPPVLSSPGGTPPAPIGTQGPAGPSPSTPAGVAAPPPPMPQTPGYIPSEKASTMSAKPRDLGPEFSQGQRQEMISRYRAIVRNPVATPVDLAEANARLQELGALQ